MVNPVAKDELKEGDLVFFKIHSRRISHVVFTWAITGLHMLHRKVLNKQP